MKITNMKELEIVNNIIKLHKESNDGYCMECGFPLEYFSHYHNEQGYRCINPSCNKVYSWRTMYKITECQEEKK